MSECRSCSAPIEWAVTDQGRKAPLDVEPGADGRFAVVGRKGKALLVVSLTNAQLDRVRAVPPGVELVLRRSHFQSCPNADEWRKT